MKEITKRRRAQSNVRVLFTVIGATPPHTHLQHGPKPHPLQPPIASGEGRPDLNDKGFRKEGKGRLPRENLDPTLHTAYI